MNQWIEVYAPPAEPKPLLTLLQREGAAPHAPCGGRGAVFGMDIYAPSPV